MQIDNTLEPRFRPRTAWVIVVAPHHQPPASISNIGQMKTQYLARPETAIEHHHADEYGEPEHVTRFVIRCAEAFDLKGTWGFCWSLSCSKARIDAFSGGGLVVNLTARETVASIDCADWLAQRMTDAGECAGHRQREAAGENRP